MNTGAAGHHEDEPRARVWVVSELYYPEQSATGYYLTGIAEGLTGMCSVGVISGQPTYAARGASGTIP